MKRKKTLLAAIKAGFLKTKAHFVYKGKYTLK